MIKTSRLNIRPFTKDDLNFLYQLHSNTEVAKTTIDGVQPLEIVEKHLNNFISHQEKYDYSQWAVFENDSKKFVGRAGLTTRSLNEEIGEKTEIRFAIMPEFWGLGYASEISNAIIKFAFEDLNMSEVSASNGPSNEKSHRILLKNGFKYIKNIIPQGYGNSEEIRYYLLQRKDFDGVKNFISTSRTSTGSV